MWHPPGRTLEISIIPLQSSHLLWQVNPISRLISMQTNSSSRYHSMQELARL
jgi:hypothetical protein